MDSDSPLISAEELHALVNAGGAIAVVDGSWHLPTVKRNAYDDYLQQHIPGTLFFDIDAIADTETDLPHMLPSAADFSQAMIDLGIGADDCVVVYDSVGMFSAARVWWMLTVFGHTHVKVLDGGLPAWVARGYATQSGAENRQAPQHPLSAVLNNSAVCDWQTVVDAIDAQSACILDARPKARFDATAPEPREGVRSGHMPTATSLPYTELLNADQDGAMRLKPAEQLVAILKAKGVTDGSNVITTCGSGVSAAVITLALTVAGFQTGQLYDGSWTEWGALADTPIVS